MTSLPSLDREYTLPPGSFDPAAAEAAGRRLAARLPSDPTTPLELSVGADVETVCVPAAALSLLADALQRMGRMDRVSLVTPPPDLTVAGLADFLLVTRLYAEKLVADGVLPSREVDGQRLVRFTDAQVYREQVDAERDRILSAMTAEAQELGFYDE